MDNVTSFLKNGFPLFEAWLRQTINQEVCKALEADRLKKKPEKQYSRDEVCQILGISLPTLWQATKDGKISATRIGRRVVYSESEVNRMIGK